MQTHFSGKNPHKTMILVSVRMPTLGPFGGCNSALNDRKDTGKPAFEPQEFKESIDIPMSRF